METEDLKKQKYGEYKNLLARVRTYTHLIFYNRKLVNPYQLASYGFRLSHSRDGHEEASCSDCENSFLLDPLIERETMELKDGYNYVIHNHEEGCKFRENSQKSCIQINHQTVAEFGTMLYSEIYCQNKQQAKVSQSFCEKGKQIPQQIEKKYVSMLQSLLQNNGMIVIFSLLGWKVAANDSAQCQYCGATQGRKESFDFIESHRSTCAMRRLKCWEPLIQKLTLNQLEERSGQFFRTEGEMMAKELREQLSKTAGKAVKSLSSFKVKIKAIKNQSQSESKDDETILKAQKTRLDKLGVVAEEIEDSLKIGIKKVKIQ